MHVNMHVNVLHMHVQTCTITIILKLTHKINDTYIGFGDTVDLSTLIYYAPLRLKLYFRAYRVSSDQTLLAV